VRVVSVLGVKDDGSGMALMILELNTLQLLEGGLEKWKKYKI